MSRPRKAKKLPPENRATPEMMVVKGSARYKIVPGRGLVEDENQDGVDDPTEHDKSNADWRRLLNLSHNVFDPENEDPRIASVLDSCLWSKLSNDITKEDCKPQKFLYDDEEENEGTKAHRRLIMEDGENDLGRFFAPILLGDPDRAEAMFKKIIKMMRNRDAYKKREGVSRITFAVEAYRNYFGEVGREPSKNELKKYMIARREIYKDQPGEGEPWTRLWKSAGLFGMSDR